MGCCNCASKRIPFINDATITPLFDETQQTHNLSLFTRNTTSNELIISDHDSDSASINGEKIDISKTVLNITRIYSLYTNRSLKINQVDSNHLEPKSKIFCNNIDQRQFQQLYKIIEISQSIQSLSIPHEITQIIAEFSTGRWKYCSICHQSISITQQPTLSTEISYRYWRPQYCHTRNLLFCEICIKHVISLPCHFCHEPYLIHIPTAEQCTFCGHSFCRYECCRRMRKFESKMECSGCDNKCCIGCYLRGRYRLYKCIICNKYHCNECIGCIGNLMDEHYGICRTCPDKIISDQVRINLVGKDRHKDVFMVDCTIQDCQNSVCLKCYPDNILVDNDGRHIYCLDHILEGRRLEQKMILNGVTRRTQDDMDFAIGKRKKRPRNFRQNRALHIFNDI